jgi:orotate phosphoribosyltransferase
MKVAKAIVLVDRQEGGVENIRHHVDNVATIVTRDELLEAWRLLKR